MRFLFDFLHARFIHPRRVNVISTFIKNELIADAFILDVGCGDGLISSLVKTDSKKIKVEGIDIFIRSHTHIPVKEFDGENIPYPDHSVDDVILIDVIHHSTNPIKLLQECNRVARRSIMIKDHLNNSAFDNAILKFMDDVGNEQHGVEVIYRYWSTKEWNAIFTQLNWKTKTLTSKVPLYPFPLSLIFGRKMHFFGVFTPAK